MVRMASRGRSELSGGPWRVGEEPLARRTLTRSAGLGGASSVGWRSADETLVVVLVVGGT